MKTTELGATESDIGLERRRWQVAKEGEGAAGCEGPRMRCVSTASQPKRSERMGVLQPDIYSQPMIASNSARVGDLGTPLANADRNAVTNASNVASSATTNG